MSMLSHTAASPLRPTHAASRRWRADEWLFALFLVLVLVGLEPLKPRDFAFLAAVADGEGNPARQVAYLGVFVLVTAHRLLRHDLRGMLVLPVSMSFVLAWLLLSTLWSVAPDITLRRAGLTGIMVMTTYMSVTTLGAERTLRVLYLVLAGILIANWQSIAAVPQLTIHQPGEADAALVGNWRGLFYHKNIAGPVSALSALLLLHFALEQRRWLDWVLFAAALVFLVGTGSKTALGLTALVVPFMLYYRHAQRTPAGRRLFLGLTISALVALSALLLIRQDAVLEFLSDPEALTGRGTIWRVVTTYAADNLLLGAGYGAFWQSGYASPALSLGAGWASTVAHSHNGYLEMLVGTGIIGLALAIMAAVVLPMRKVLSFQVTGAPLLAAWIFFCILLNMTETRLFQGAREEWVLFLVAIALLQALALGRVARR